MGLPLEVTSYGGDSESEQGCVAQKTGIKTSIKKNNNSTKHKTFIAITVHNNIFYLLPPLAIWVSEHLSVISLSHKEHHTLAPGVVMPILIKVSSRA